MEDLQCCVGCCSLSCGLASNAEVCRRQGLPPKSISVQARQQYAQCPDIPGAASASQRNLRAGPGSGAGAVSAGLLRPHGCTAFAPCPSADPAHRTQCAICALQDRSVPAATLGAEISPERTPCASCADPQPLRGRWHRCSRYTKGPPSAHGGNAAWLRCIHIG